MQLKRDKIKAIMNNPTNRMFFSNKSFHGDKGYNIYTKDGEDLFAVKTSHGMAYYKLNGTRIGNFTNLFDN